MLDQIHRDEEGDKQQEAEQEAERDDKSLVANDPKREARAEWWLNVIKNAFAHEEDSLFHHPAILEAVKQIEKADQAGEKVLVFGRFIRPLRALVDLLNAREMLRRLESDPPRKWSQSKVHDDSESSEWPAVRAAHSQLGSSISLDSLDDVLASQYNAQRRSRERIREQLLANVKKGLEEIAPTAHIMTLFGAFERSVASQKSSGSDKSDLLSIVSRAISDLLGDDPEACVPSEYGDAFRQLMDAVSDRDEADTNRDGELDDDEASAFWNIIEERLYAEYNRPQGSFARLMFGGTKPESRRMIQLAFNRNNSFPRVLVAQSLVGREGLNLHKACRTVFILHPEWNPGVVEQQIGRVDRVGSHWCSSLEQAILDGAPIENLPRIEVRPVIFQATYDEHNWRVLRNRWDTLRAQLHGLVIAPTEIAGSGDFQDLATEICSAAPNFSPLKNYKENKM